MMDEKHINEEPVGFTFDYHQKVEVDYNFGEFIKGKPIIVITGEIGSGKSTFIRTITNKKNIDLDDHGELDQKGDKSFRKMKISFNDDIYYIIETQGIDSETWNPKQIVSDLAEENLPYITLVVFFKSMSRINPNTRDRFKEIQERLGMIKPSQMILVLNKCSSEIFDKRKLEGSSLNKAKKLMCYKPWFRSQVNLYMDDMKNVILLPDTGNLNFWKKQASEFKLLSPKMRLRAPSISSSSSSGRERSMTVDNMDELFNEMMKSLWTKHAFDCFAFICQQSSNRNTVEILKLK